jgi:hypothetical protein
MLEQCITYFVDSVFREPVMTISKAMAMFFLDQAIANSERTISKQKLILCFY